MVPYPGENGKKEKISKKHHQIPNMNHIYQCSRIPVLNHRPFLRNLQIFFLNSPN
jgi:hypothetical protein